MNQMLTLLIATLTFFSCNTKSNISEVEVVAADISFNQKKYPFFHDKFLISSSSKPIEEDARNTVSNLALTIYEDIKKYSFIDIIPRGMMSITVAEFKEKDTTFSSKEYLKDLIKVYESNEAFKIDFENSKLLKNNFLSGYSTKGRTYVKNKVNSYMYLSVLSDGKTMMTVLAVYENLTDLNIIENILESIKPNK